MNTMIMFTEEEIETARQNGVSYQTLYNRVYGYGWKMEKAISTPVQNRFGNPMCQFTEEELAQAKANGVSHSALCNRIRKGWNRKKALTTKPLNYRDRLHVEQYLAESLK